MQESMLHVLSAREKEKAELSAEVERLEGEVQNMEASSSGQQQGSIKSRSMRLEHNVSSLQVALLGVQEEKARVDEMLVGLVQKVEVLESQLSAEQQALEGVRISS